MENFKQWKSAMYAQIVEKYLTNDSCYICTKCGECLPFTNTCMCNKCGKIFTFENGYKLTKCKKTIISILQDVHGQVADIYALNVKDALEMWSSYICTECGKHSNKGKCEKVPKLKVSI